MTKQDFKIQSLINLILGRFFQYPNDGDGSARFYYKGKSIIIGNCFIDPDYDSSEHLVKLIVNEEDVYPEKWELPEDDEVFFVGQKISPEELLEVLKMAANYKVEMIGTNLVLSCIIELKDFLIGSPHNVQSQENKDKIESILNLFAYHRSFKATKFDIEFTDVQPVEFEEEPPAVPENHLQQKGYHSAPGNDTGILFEGEPIKSPSFNYSQLYIFITLWIFIIVGFAAYNKPVEKTTVISRELHQEGKEKPIRAVVAHEIDSLAKIMDSIISEGSLRLKYEIEDN